jgi:hypothetical protein
MDHYFVMEGMLVMECWIDVKQQSLTQLSIYLMIVFELNMAMLSYIVSQSFSLPLPFC